MGGSGPLPSGLSLATCGPRAGGQQRTCRARELLSLRQPCQVQLTEVTGLGRGPPALNGLSCPPRSLDLSNCAAEQGPDVGAGSQGATLIFSLSWMTHGSAAASGMQGGHSGHWLGGNLGSLAHVDPCLL